MGSTGKIRQGVLKLKWWRLFLGLLILETLGLLAYDLLTGSQPEEQFIFNLSLLRFLITIAISAFLFLLFYIFSQSFKTDNLINKVITNDKRTFLLLIASYAGLAASMLFLDANTKEMGDYLQLYLKLKPFLAWGFWVALQACFFSMIWFCHLYIGNVKTNNEKDRGEELITLLVIFATMIIIKTIWIIPSAYGPVIQGDELRYFNMAKLFYDGVFNIENVNHSPYLYPVMLSVSFLFGENAYTVMKFLNVLYSSSIIFPLYLIARKYFSKNISLLVTLCTCVLPYHLLFPRMLMSENLYFPILLWVMLLLLHQPQTQKLHGPWYLLTGFNIGLLYLTRYITLAVIPILLLAWWYINPRKNRTDGCVSSALARDIERLSSRSFLSFTWLVLGIIIGYSPWMIAGLSAGVPIRLLLGFGITEQTTASQLTLYNLLIWLGLYFCYLVLMAAPVLPFFSYFLGTRFKDRNIETRNWFILLGGLIVGFLAACVRHSWRALYNGEIPARIMGRYILYFTPLFIISALLLIRQQTSFRHKTRIKHIALTLLLPFAIVALAYALLFGNLFHLHDGNLINVLGSVDGAYLQYLGIYFFLIILAMYIAASWHTWNGRTDLLVKLSFGLFIVFYIVGMPAYYQDILSNQDFQYLADRIIALHQSGEPKLGDTIRILTPPGTSARERALMFNTILFNNDALYVTSIENYSINILYKETGIQDVVIGKVDDLDLSDIAVDEIIEFNNRKYVLTY